MIGLPWSTTVNAPRTMAGACAAALALALSASGASRFDHVVMISIDGLHPAVLAPELIDRHPTLARLMRGPHTLEARTDPDATITLPNHVSMITSLPLISHGWQWNDDPPAVRHGGSIHARAGRYIAGCFDVAHDHGVSTALFASKTKFWLFEQSYGHASGAKDEHSPDHGRAKLDLVMYARSSGTLSPQLAARLALAASRSQRTLDLLHIAEPDTAGHAHEWDLTPGSKYLESIARVDAWLGELLASIDANDALHGRVAFIVTTDHGGGKPEKTHTDASAPCNFTIPFIVWLGVDGEALDLYAINGESRARPSADAQPEADAAPPPIRNGEVGNLALQLLGLPAIPASQHNAGHDLRLVRHDASVAPRPGKEPHFAANPTAMPESSDRSGDQPRKEASQQSWDTEPAAPKVEPWGPTLPTLRFRAQPPPSPNTDRTP